MRKTLMVAALVSMAVGCAGESDSDAIAKTAAGSNKAASEVTAAASEPDLWDLARKESAMDGQTVQAQRIFQFPGDAKFVVDVSCRTSDRRLSMTIMSIIGDADSPAESSAFVTTNGAFPGTLAPAGRVKVRGEDPTMAAAHFEMGDYSNQIRMWNGALNEDLPMVVEAKIGAGSFELVIDNSISVQEVTRACAVPERAATAGAREAAAPDHGGESSTSSAATSNAGSTDTSVAPIARVEPSYDCAKASSKTEQAICADNQLSMYDNVLAKNYRAVLAANIGEDARGALKAGQRVWLKSRDECADDACLVQLYATRINAVCDTPVLSGIAPECELAEGAR